MSTEIFDSIDKAGFGSNVHEVAAEGECRVLYESFFAITGLQIWVFLNLVITVKIVQKSRAYRIVAGLEYTFVQRLQIFPGFPLLGFVRIESE